MLAAAFCVVMSARTAETDACIRRVSRSQQHEDERLLPLLRLLTGGGPGTFVEIGALNGVLYSNTIALETCLHWTGLLIEGNPRNAQMLLRSSRRAHKLHSAVCDPPGNVTFYEWGTQYGGEVGMHAATYMQRYQSRFAKGSKDAKNMSTYSTVRVPCRPMSHMLEEVGLRSVDFLSLDVEGSELKVLQAADVHAFKLIMVELDARNLEKDEAVRDLLRHGGFTFVQCGVGSNEVWVQRALLSQEHTGTLSCNTSVPSKKKLRGRANAHSASLPKPHGRDSSSVGE